METTSQLSTAMRAYLQDPEGFVKRMHERAEQLWADNYWVEPADEIGLFLIHTPKGEQHTVNVLDQDCTCLFRQKAEDMREVVGCKHLLGIEQLVTDQLSALRAIIGQHELSGHADRATAQREDAERLEAAWQATLDTAIDRQAEAEQGDEWNTCANDRTERELREMGVEEF